jgi:hypothetical protein
LSESAKLEVDMFAHSRWFNFFSNQI